jgi:hypothetical protein
MSDVIIIITDLITPKKKIIFFHPLYREGKESCVKEIV